VAVGWFERQCSGRDPGEVSKEHARYVRAAGVDRALDELAGPFGVRRFLVRFSLRGAAMRLDSVDAMPLNWGGGPPPEDPSGRVRARLEATLGRLHRNMATGPAWSRGAISYVRDAQGRTEVQLSFDDDADDTRLDALPLPGPPGHPLEDPGTEHMMRAWEGPMAEVQVRSAAVTPDWDEWEVIDDHTLVLYWGGGPEGPPPTDTRRARCRTLATYQPRWSRFTWRTGDPLFEDAVFSVEFFPATFDAAVELALVAAARLQARWLFVQPYDESGSVLMVAVFDG
jgi:hypothetical protein